MDKFSIEKKNGEKIYKDERGEKIDTYSESVEWIINYRLEPLHDFLKMSFEEDATQKAAYIALALLEKAECDIYDAVKYIKNNHGEVEIIRATHRQAIEPELMLDIKFKPAKAILGKTAKKRSAVSDS